MYCVNTVYLPLCKLYLELPLLDLPNTAVPAVVCDWSGLVGSGGSQEDGFRVQVHLSGAHHDLSSREQSSFPFVIVLQYLAESNKREIKSPISGHITADRHSKRTEKKERETHTQCTREKKREYKSLFRHGHIS